MLDLPGGKMFANSNTGQSNKARLSLEEFCRQMQGYLANITELRPSLRLASMLFGTEDRTILPIQCRKAMHSLEEMDELVQEFSELLNVPERLPVIMIALRYSLLSILNLMDKQINRLLDLLNSYRVICISSSQHEKQLRKEIHRSFERLLQYNTTISEQVERLNDEAEDQEQRLLSLLEER